MRLHTHSQDTGLVSKSRWGTVSSRIETGSSIDVPNHFKDVEPMAMLRKEDRTRERPSQLTDFYHRSCLRLAQSLILKSEASVKAMNEAVKFKYYHQEDLQPDEDENNYKTWRYYCHLAGEYHYSDDIILQVRSLDTLQTIDFTKENLQNHRATLAHYSEQGEYYWELVRTYPEYQTLINGICNPIDKEVAYHAEDNDILYYNRNLVETQEDYLIPLLQHQIKRYFERFNSIGYASFDPYYPALKLGILGTQLPGMIIALRENRVHTIQAHSYHIWSYLGSIYRLDQFRRYLTHEQAMWLYRNIRYIDIHSGKSETFEKLIHWLLSKRHIPLHKYGLGRDSDNILDTNQIDLRVYREQVNLKHIDYSTDKDYTASDLLGKERKLALRNETFEESTLGEIDKRLHASVIQNEHTKLFETSILDYSNRELYDLVGIGLNYWIYLAYADKYPVMKSITNPSTGELFNITSQQGVIAYIYLLMKAYNLPHIDVNNIEIPAISVKDIFFPTVNWDKLRDKFVAYKKTDIDEVLFDLRSRYPQTKTIYSNEQFIEFIKYIQSYRNSIRDLYGTFHELEIYGEIRHVAERLMFQRLVKLAPTGTTFAQFLKSNSWSFDKLNRTDALALANTIYGAFTGGDQRKLNEVNDIQVAMVEIMRRLSSYSIQFTHEINAQDVLILDASFLRYGRIRMIDIALSGLYRGLFTHAYYRKAKERSTSGLNLIYTNSNSKVFGKRLDAVELPYAVQFIDHAYRLSKRYHRLGMVGYRRTSSSQKLPRVECYLYNGTLYPYWNDLDPSRDLRFSTPKPGLSTPPGV